MMNGPELQLRIKRFLRQQQMPKTAFGRKALNDPNFVDRLARCDPRSETIAKVLTFMESFDAHP
jgi:hypothetical protein